MARYIAYHSVDMSDIGIIDDGTGEDVDGGIKVTTGDWVTYFGGDFRSDGFRTYGTLESMERWFQDELIWELLDIDRDIYVYDQFIFDDDPLGSWRYLLSGADSMQGSFEADLLRGYSGADTISGGSGADWLDGGWGDDVLWGGTGRDLLDGNAGGDRMAGGLAGDLYFVDDAGDRVVETGTGFDEVISTLSFRLPALVEALALAGTAGLSGVGNPLGNGIGGDLGDDTIRGLGGDDRLSGGEGADVVLGGNGNDTLFGNAGDDTLIDGAGDDDLFGGAGRDILRGGEGDDLLYGDWARDVLVGGEGADTLTGGTGNDVFRYLSALDSERGSASDTITDFLLGDRIDLRGVDADITAAGSQAFDFIETGRFSGTAGELRHWGGRLTGDTDGDRLIDFAILLPSIAPLTEGDLLL